LPSKTRYGKIDWKENKSDGKRIKNTWATIDDFEKRDVIGN